MRMKITIIIPVKNPIDLDTFLAKNGELLKEMETIVIDSGGGEKLREIASIYQKKRCSIWQARRAGLKLASEEFVLNLDSDVIIPKKYIEKALSIFAKKPKVGAVSIFFGNIANQGALEFGISIWRKEVMKELYDYNPREMTNLPIIKVKPRFYVQAEFPYCECTYMWRRLIESGYKLETLNLRAKHLKVR